MYATLTFAAAVGLTMGCKKLLEQKQVSNDEGELDEMQFFEIKPSKSCLLYIKTMRTKNIGDIIGWHSKLLEAGMSELTIVSTVCGACFFGRLEYTNEPPIENICTIPFVVRVLPCKNIHGDRYSVIIKDGSLEQGRSRIKQCLWNIGFRVLLPDIIQVRDDGMIKHAFVVQPLTKECFELAGKLSCVEKIDLYDIHI